MTKKNTIYKELVFDKSSKYHTKTLLGDKIRDRRYIKPAIADQKISNDNRVGTASFATSKKILIYKSAMFSSRKLINTLGLLMRKQTYHRVEHGS
jgi:hypothetical protein